MIKVIFKD